MKSERKYKCLLFDFDRTLWDVDVNQKEALRAIYLKEGLSRLCPDFSAFYEVYLEINDRLWLEYRDEKISKEYLRNHRFVELLERFGVADNRLSMAMSDEYIRTAPYFNSLIPHSRETVSYLSGRYDMHIITNGFNEVQHLKLKNSGLEPFFGKIFTSEDAGANKPHKRIFEYAFEMAGASPEETVIIGDDPENDVQGGIAAGIDTVFFNPKGLGLPQLRPTYEISSLLELKELF